jgi:hypothetical protein
VELTSAILLEIGFDERYRFLTFTELSYFVFLFAARTVTSLAVAVVTIGICNLGNKNSCLQQLLLFPTLRILSVYICGKKPSLSF